MAGDLSMMEQEWVSGSRSTKSVFAGIRPEVYSRCTTTALFRMGSEHRPLLRSQVDRFVDERSKLSRFCRGLQLGVAQHPWTLTLRMLAVLSESNFLVPNRIQPGLVPSLFGHSPRPGRPPGVSTAMGLANRQYGKVPRLAVAVGR